MSRNSYSGGYFSSRRQYHSRPYNDSSHYYEQQYPYDDMYRQPTWQRGRERRPSPDYNQYVVHDPSSSQRDRASPTPPPASSPLAKSPSPPPPPRRSPSPTYLRTSLVPSEPLPQSSSPRKLLILDLNGTLLIRSPHQGPRGTGPRIRSAHPRPYMLSFRNYVFHPDTKKWLDVMVWSSAQPHSVDDMVGKAFGEKKGELKAVWARDTLGLSEHQYRQKTQTTKDLTKPWAYFSSLSSSSSSSSPSSSPEPVPSCPSTSTPRAEAHSALTTVLLDDSPLKAHLQPYNHVCIKEYDSPLRRSDLDILEAQRAKQRQEELDADPDTSGTLSPDTSGALSPDPSEDLDERTHKRKRRKKRKQVQALLERAEGKVYDQTLLAIIGILDETRVQSNVAGWIRGGGLWGPKRDEIKTYQAQDREVPAALTSESSESVDGQDAHLDKRQKVRGASASPVDQAEVGETEQVKAGNDAVSTVSPPVEVPESADVTETKMWFEDEETVRYWAGKGREALERLGIPVEDGIEG